MIVKVYCSQLDSSLLKKPREGSLHKWMNENVNWRILDVASKPVADVKDILQEFMQGQILLCADEISNLLVKC